MTDRTEKANARLAGFQERTRTKMLATAYSSSAKSRQDRAALAAKMRARIQQRTPGQ